jgi:hypothetical protein
MHDPPVSPPHDKVAAARDTYRMKLRAANLGATEAHGGQQRSVVGRKKKVVKNVGPVDVATQGEEGRSTKERG